MEDATVTPEHQAVLLAGGSGRFRLAKFVSPEPAHAQCLSGSSRWCKSPKRLATLRPPLQCHVSSNALFGHLGVSKRMCLQSFPSLATSAIRWLLCVVVPSDSSFRKLCAGHVTLISWMLRFPARFSNPVSSGFILRGGVRLGWD